MKKLIILTSVLALAACGGGSGGPDERFVVRSSSPYAYVTQSAAESNKDITSIASEVRKCVDDNCAKNTHNGNGTNLPTVTPRISSYSDNTGNWNVYNLSDVKFNMADEGLEPGDESFNFVVDDKEGSATRGKIIGIDMGLRDSETHPQHGNTNVKADFVRNDDNSFSGYVKHNGEHADANGWTYVEKANFESLGKGLTNKLTYSDFGQLDLSEAKEYWKPVFIGGYDVKKISPADVNVKKTSKDDVFSGKVVGYVASNDGHGNVETFALESNNATLTFDKDNNKTTTLNASFTDWYNMVYTENDTTKSVVLSGYNGDHQMLTTPEDGKVTIENTGILSDIRYFGDNNVPIESVGLIQIRDCGGTECPEHFDSEEVRVDVGFGVSRKITD